MVRQLPTYDLYHIYPFGSRPFTLITNISCLGLSAEQTRKPKLQTWPAVLIHMNFAWS